MQTQGSAAYARPPSPSNMAVFNAAPHVLQAPCSSQVFRVLESSFRGRNLKKSSGFGKFKTTVRADGHAVPSQICELRAHFNQGFFSGNLVLDISKPCFLEGRNSKFMDLPATACQCSTKTVQIEQMSSGNWRVSDNWRASSVHESGFMRKDEGTLSSEVSESPLESWGWLSVGVCGNALIMRIGKNSRCFHAQSYEQTDSCDYRTSFNALNVSTKSRELNICDKVIQRTSISMLPVTATTTKTRPGKSRRKRSQKKPNIVARNLFERNLFHLCEVIFCSPSLNSKSTALNICNLSQGNLRELVHVVKQAAAGLASVGVTVMFFVVSKMSTTSVTFEKHQVLSLVVGVSLFTLSFATMKFADVLKGMADVHNK